MAVKQNISPYAFQKQLFRLPRELRDLIYTEVFSDSVPIPLEDVRATLAALPLLAPDGNVQGILPEVVEAFYTHSTFEVSVSRPQASESRCAIGGSMFPQYEKEIRKLIVHAEEELLLPEPTLENLEWCLQAGWHETRVLWASLLQLTRLEKLTVRFQKHAHDRLFWADFSPILYELRERHPKLQLSFGLSFDNLLEQYWYDPFWTNCDQLGNLVEKPYDPMGFVDVMELFEPPTDEDYAHVQEHEHLMQDKDTHGQDILRGLLDEVASQKRALAIHYVVKEPELLRVRMMEHYDIYKRMARVRQTVGVQVQDPANAA